MHSPYQPGTILADAYRVERELGAGGMGCVLEVFNLRLNRREALKLMRPELAAYPDAAKRFLREARAAAALESDHVVRVHHSGMLATGEPFITMAYLRGVDLESVLIESGALPVETAIKYIREACFGLAEAHEKGLIHRDIKPSNLFLAERARGERQIKILDFGIAKAIEPMPGATALTRGEFIGTPPYMSPEQLGADELDARTDVWSLGAVFYELVTGRRPFSGAGIAKMYAAVMRPLEPPSTYAPALPAAVEAIILRCLERDRSNRYATAGELGAALDSLGEKRPAPPPPPPEALKELDPLSSRVTPAPPPGVHTRGPRAFRIALIGTALLLVGSLLAVLYPPRDVDPVVPSGTPTPQINAKPEPLFTGAVPLVPLPVTTAAGSAKPAGPDAGRSSGPVKGTLPRVDASCREPDTKDPKKCLDPK